MALTPRAQTIIRLLGVQAAWTYERMAGIGVGHAAAPLLRELCDTMVAGSLCALGGMAPFPVLSILNHFPEDLRARENAGRAVGEVA